jgi:DNA mismatch endonuclease (patch repair protein)
LADSLDPELRSAVMRRVRSTDTRPELVVRSLLHRMGYRFRLHRKGLPGRPDVVFPGRRKAIFVHGCFWHGHPGCPRAGRPATNRAFWDAKLDRNLERDARALAGLAELGWSVLVVWECSVKRLDALETELRRFLENDASIDL